MSKSKKSWWHDEAKRLFKEEGLKPKEIAILFHRTVYTVNSVLNGHAETRHLRKKQNKEYQYRKQKEYQHKHYHSLTPEEKKEKLYQKKLARYYRDEELAKKRPHA